MRRHSDPTTLAGAVHLLAEAQLVDASVPLTEELGAVGRLGAAPADDLWNRGLLIGLHSHRPEVVDATVRAAVGRLARMTERPEIQDSFLGAILDACFLHLPGGRPQSRGADETARQSAEQAAARLITAVGRLLATEAPEFEHHRARLLARARQIKHRQGRGFLAEAVVGLQRELAAGDRSDALVARELARLRKLDLYTSPNSAESALLAYLDDDRSLPLEETSQELWQAYRLLLAWQTKERAGRAILRAMDNLIRWLDATPQTPRAREAVLGQVVQMARLSVPRDQLDPRIARHLEAHLELLPGKDDPQDLLVQLRTRYDATAGDEYLVKGLELLRRLPLVRLRSEELCDFILAPARRQRSGAVWQALLALVESIVTGIADLVVSRQTLDTREQRRQRLLRELLAHDQRLRQLLYRLATDRSIDLSHDPQVDAEARERAWRILLRCLPPDHVERQREGLLGHDGRFFFATLDEAGDGHRRELWEALLERWDQLAGAERPVAERRERVRAVLGFFRKTRDYLALREGPNTLGRLIGLAFDDADAEVRAMAEAALVESGYGLEVERERGRRSLLQLSDALSGSNRQLIAYEQELARLGRDAVTTQLQRAEQSLAIHDLLLTRERVVTEGWIFTASLTVDLEELRIALAEALARAQRQMELLHTLRRAMQDEHANAQKVQSAMQALVRQEEEQERALRDLQARLARARKSEADARGQLSDVTRQLAREQSNPPAQPRNTGDPDRDQAAASRYRNELARHQARIESLRSNEHQARGSIAAAQQDITSCESGIVQTQAMLARLQQQIAALRTRLNALRERIAALGRELHVQQVTLAALRQEIRQLEERSHALQARERAHAEQVRGAIAANSQQIERSQGTLQEIQRRLHDLSVSLNETGHRRDDQQTRSQQLVQAIDNGREQYDRVAERAIPESRQADVTGHSQREAHERESADSQESLVQYAEGMHHAIHLDAPLPVRPGRRPTDATPGAQRERIAGGGR